MGRSTAIILAYVNQILLPTLYEGDIVVLDNLSSYKVAGVKSVIESVGAKVVYLAVLLKGYQGGWN